MKIKESIDQDEVIRREDEAFNLYWGELQVCTVDWAAQTADPSYFEWASKLEGEKK